MAEFLKNSNIRTKIFVMLAIFFVIVASIIIYYSYSFQKQTIEDNAAEDVLLSQENFLNLQSRDVGAMNSVLNVLLEDERIKDLYLSGNRDELFEYCNKRFLENKELYGITHWYFIGLDDNVHLRMHNKEMYGDFVNRITYKKSKEINGIGSGLELGKTAFALRVVSPYYKDGKLIGYMELGQEIDHFLGDMKKETSNAMAIVVSKEKLNRADWASVRKESGLRDNWDDNENFVIVSANVEYGSSQMNALNSFIKPEYFLHPQKSEKEYLLGNYFEKNKKFNVGEFHVIDASGSEAGSVYIAVDDSENYKSLNLGMTKVALSVVAFFILFSFLIWFIIKKAIINPLNRINENMSAISVGNYNTRLEINSNDEIGRISKTFNKMTRAIRESRASVDLKVAAQTSDTLNQKKSLEDQQVAMSNILEDIEDEKEKAERSALDLEKFKLAVDNASDHIAITDSEGIILYGNKAIEKITGYSLSDVIGQKAGTKKNWGGNMEVSFYEELWRTIKIDKKIFAGKVENIRKNGEKYHAETSISPILDDEDNVKFFVAIERDISKEVEVDKAKTEFVSLASHQLRTPLTAFKWDMEMLFDLIPKGKTKKDKEIQELLKEMNECSEGMIDLVNGLLNVSRIDLGTFAVDPKVIYPRHISDVVIRELRRPIETKKLKISVSYDEQVGTIAADPKLLKIIMQNLISNAVKYTPNNGSIAISLKKDGKHLLFSVKDSGIGIPKKQQPKIFGKLFRADNAIQNVSSEGTGLGLYVAKAVVEQSGGEIWFKSEENKGTTFSFTLPLSGMKKKEGNKELTPTK